MNFKRLFEYRYHEMLYYTGCGGKNTVAIS
jgi:hypothetical protein